MSTSVYHPTDRPNFTRVTVGDTVLYFSYETLVAFVTHGTGLVCCENDWSTTTGKHLNHIQPDHSKRIPRAEFERMAAELGLS